MNPSLLLACLPRFLKIEEGESNFPLFSLQGRPTPFHNFSQELLLLLLLLLRNSTARKGLYSIHTAEELLSYGESSRGVLDPQASSQCVVQVSILFYSKRRGE